ncbi:MAG: DUF4118 domain-containing protein [Oscillibacter sp.]|nr:DUF4118 domain-containing protein [Oscillibacter sp.]
MKDNFFKWFPFSWRDFWVTFLILLGATGTCAVLRQVDSNGEFVSMIFVLAVMLVSRLTSGYLFGTLSSLIGVICVNYVFTYPYFAFNFTIAGYPLTFIVMLVVSVMTSAMTTQIKLQEHFRAETEKEKARADLLRSVSHDIRTPLTSIIGATSTILEGGDFLTEAQKRRLLEDTRSEAQWLIRVVENLLSVTRMGDSRAYIDKKSEAAEEIVGEALQKFRKRFQNVKVTVSVPEELLMVPMDAILIEQVLANLMENAISHGQTTTHIRLSVSVEGNSAVFSVQDNGQGIPPQQLPNLFTGISHSADNRTVDGKRNMGLGLTVCKAIVQAHGGTILGRNLPQGGAEFAFRLPLTDPRTNKEVLS